MRILLILLFLLGGYFVRAQTFDEWFKQKKTQLLYYTQQISLLESYDLLLRDGYAAVSGGLAVVRDLKKGEFDLQADYFASLQKVKVKLPGIAEKIGAIIAVCIRKNGPVIEGARAEALMLQKELQLLTNGDGYALNDAQRIERLQVLHIQVIKLYQFVQGWNGSDRLLRANNSRELDESRMLNKIYSR